MCNLEKAIHRTENSLALLDKEWAKAGAICCPACMFGDAYQRLVTKLTRQQEWLNRLKSKA